MITGSFGIALITGSLALVGSVCAHMPWHEKLAWGILAAGVVAFAIKWLWDQLLKGMD